MYRVPQEVLRIPYQEIADSPTEKYYTNWRVYDKRLTLPDSTRLDPVEARGLVERGYCVVDPSLGGEVRCEGLSLRPYTLERPPIHERMAYYHYHRSRSGAELTLRNAKLALLLRGGEAYKGYTLRISVEPGASAELVLVDTSLLGGLKTASIELVLGEASRADVTHLVLHSGESAVYEVLRVRAGRGSSLTYRAGGRPGEMSRIRLEVALEAEGASFEGDLGYAANQRRHGDMILNVTHYAPRTRSRVEGRGIARDEARLVLRGVARILGSAPGSSSHVDMHVMVVGDKARGRSVPMLEIYTGDVEEASHSASASTVLEDILFYAATRGLSGSELIALMEAGLFETVGVIPMVEALGLRL